MAIFQIYWYFYAKLWSLSSPTPRYEDYKIMRSLSNLLLSILSCISSTEWDRNTRLTRRRWYFQLFIFLLLWTRNGRSMSVRKKPLNPYFQPFSEWEDESESMETFLRFSCFKIKDQKMKFPLNILSRVKYSASLNVTIVPYLSCLNIVRYCWVGWLILKGNLRDF